MIVKKVTILGAATGAVLGAADPASAQEFFAPVGQVVFSVTGAGLSQSKTDIDGGGEFSFNRALVEVAAQYGLAPRTSLGLSVAFGQSEYDFSGDYDPFGRIEEFEISTPLFFGVNDQVSALIIPTFRYNGEEGASQADSWSQGLIAGAFWRLSDTLVLGPGFGVFHEIDKEITAFPFLLIDWQIAERWSLSTGEGLGATQGPGLSLSYAATEALTFGLTARVEDVMFRLDEDGDNADGIGQNQSNPILATVSWEPSPLVSISGFAGYQTNGQLTLRDEDGKKIERREYDDTPVFGGVATFRF